MPRQRVALSQRDRGALARAFRAIFFGFIPLSSFASRVAAGPLEDATAALEGRDFALLGTRLS